MNSTTRTALILLTGASLALTGCATTTVAGTGAMGDTATAVSSAAPAASTAGAGPSTGVDTDARAIESFVTGLGDGTATDRAVAGSAVALYADVVDAMVRSNPATYPDVEPIRLRDGWQVADGVVLTDFVVDPQGLIADASRNGVPLSTTVTPGDGTVHTRTATESWEDFTGQATFTGRAFQLFDDTLRVFVDVDNQTNADAWLSFDGYVLDGTQYPDAYLGDAGSATKPTVKRTVMLVVDAPRGGGTLTIDTVVDSFSSPDAQVVVAVPALG